MVIDDKATAMAGTAAHSLSEGDLMEGGEGDDWRGLDQENGAKIRRREAQKQLQQISPADAGCLGLTEGDKTAADAAEGGAAARGR